MPFEEILCFLAHAAVVDDFEYWENSMSVLHVWGMEYNEVGGGEHSRLEARFRVPLTVDLSKNGPRRSSPVYRNL